MKKKALKSIIRSWEVVDDIEAIVKAKKRFWNKERHITYIHYIRANEWVRNKRHLV